MPVVDNFTALLQGDSWWGSQTPLLTGRPVFLTFSFEESAAPYLSSAGYGAAFLSSFQSFSASEREATRQALQLWADASGVRFFEVGSGSGDITFSHFNFALDNRTSGFAGLGYGPNTYLTNSSASESPISGDVFMNTGSSGSVLYLMLHEIGHALGLKHPFDGDPTLTASLDNHANTVMSYTGPAVTSLGPLDVQAAQYLYGPPSSDGAQVSSWSWNQSTYTLTQAGFETDDVMRGVGASDIMYGGGGSDLMFGAGGNDVLDGGPGRDFLFGGDGDDRLDGGPSDFSTAFGGAGSALYFRSVNGDSRNDIVQLDRDGSAYVWISTGASFSAYARWSDGSTPLDQVIDLNGDGRSDLLQFYAGNQYVALSNGSGFGSWSVWGTGATASDRAVDLNGDGRADLIQFYAGRVYGAMSTGSGFSSWSVWGSGATAADQLIDFNGDGRADLFQFYAGREYVALSNGSGFGGWNVWGTGATAADRFVDVNGDGMRDVVQLYSGRTYVATSNGTSFANWAVWSAAGGAPGDSLADVNGDSRADLVQFYNGRAYVALSNGSGFGAYSSWGDAGFLGSDILVDVTGDSRADVVQFYDGRAYVAVSSGAGFGSFTQWGTGVISGADWTSPGDVLHGGSGNDIFSFSQHWGQDTIRDFSAGSAIGDVIAIDRRIAADFATVLGHASDVSGGVMLNFDAQDSIFLQGVARSQLNANDFGFF